MIGFQITKQTLDQKSGSLAFELRQWCDSVTRLQAGVMRELAVDPDFLTTGMGNTPEDATILTNALVSMVTVKDAITGQGTIGTATNFIQITQQLTGID